MQATDFAILVTEELAFHLNEWLKCMDAVLPRLENGRESKGCFLPNPISDELKVFSRSN
jgi:hypothetical protein